VYVEWDGELQKIAALGLKVANGCTYHGVSLNVAMDLEPFGWINPCGYPGLKTVDLATLGVQTSVEKVGWELAHALAGLFDRTEGNHEHPVGTEYGSRFG
jgi:lipoyl(octanoyl) transferase